MPSPVESLYPGYTVNMACCWRTLGLLLCIAVLAVDTQMPGGLQDVSTDREDVQRAARFAVAEYNKGSNHPYSSKMIRIVSAQAQVVAGMKYYLHIEMERTHGCHNEEFSCKFVVLEVLWKDITELLDTKCKNSLS
ncbi:cystatin-like [Polyodon spathula]|uniref:cystatin-like n=1 Tax=Polyodon spathula TaxID=7913 RepID=UPI001B7DA0F0|nr:cystatin-like [Polyodon spathula]